MCEHLQFRRVAGAWPSNAAASLVVSNPCIFVIYPVSAARLQLNCLSNSKARPKPRAGFAG